MCVYRYIYMCVCVCVCVQIYIYIYIYTSVYEKCMCTDIYALQSFSFNT